MTGFNVKEIGHFLRAEREVASPHAARLLEFRSMYEIPGQDPVTERALHRYLADKKQDSAIRSLVENLGISFEKKILSTSEDARASLIEQALAAEDPAAQKAGAEMIGYAPEDTRASLIEQALAAKDPAVQKAGAEMIKYAPQDVSKELFEFAKQKAFQALRRWTV